MRQRKSTLELIRIASRFDDLKSFYQAEHSTYQTLRRRPEGVHALEAMFGEPISFKTPERTLRDCLDLAEYRKVFDATVYAERFPTEHNWMRKKGLLTKFRKELAKTDLTQSNNPVMLSNSSNEKESEMKHEKTTEDIQRHKDNIYVTRFMNRSGLEGLDTNIVLLLTDSKESDEQRKKLRLRYKYIKFAARLDEILSESGKKLDLDHMDKIEAFVKGL